MIMATRINKRFNWSSSILGFSLIPDISQGSSFHDKIKYKEKEMERASFPLLKDIGGIYNAFT